MGYQYLYIRELFQRLALRDLHILSFQYTYNLILFYCDLVLLPVHLHVFLFTPSFIFYFNF